MRIGGIVFPSLSGAALAEGLSALRRVYADAGKGGGICPGSVFGCDRGPARKGKGPPLFHHDAWRERAPEAALEHESPSGRRAAAFPASGRSVSAVARSVRWH